MTQTDMINNKLLVNFDCPDCYFSFYFGTAKMD